MAMVPFISFLYWHGISYLATYEAFAAEARAFTEIRLLNRNVVITIDGKDKFDVGLRSVIYFNLILVILVMIKR